VQKLHARLVLWPKGVAIMSKLVRIVVQLPIELKEQLDALKQQGYTTSGFIRATLERELNKLNPRPDTVVRKVANK
jgi:metal-responsive CopG/Arc/MetJ family transcriptional regulator